MKNVKIWTTCLKWGGVLGIALALFELVKMAARNVDYAGAKMFDIALIIVLILVLYAGIKELKEKMTERLSFAKAFLGCIVITAVGSALFFLYAMIHYTAIDKDGLKKKREISLVHYRELINNDTIKTVELNDFIGTTRSTLKKEAQKVCADTVDSKIVNEALKGLSMIDTVYAEKMISKRSLDTADSYKLANFLPYAKLVLVNTLEMYVAQNADQPSTPIVQATVQRTIAQMSAYNPSDIRYEKRKSEVPQYEKLSVYVFVCTFMNFLYGLFFGLFVALFHYTSKMPLTSPDETNESISDSSLDNNDK